jgi:hypothetical protein
MNPLRLRMLEDMRIRNSAPGTQQAEQSADLSRHRMCACRQQMIAFWALRATLRWFNERNPCPVNKFGAGQ